MASQIAELASPALRAMTDPYDTINPPVAIIMPGQPYLLYGTTLDGETGFGGVLGGQPQSVPAAPTDFNLDALILLAKATTQERTEQALDTWLGVQNDTNVVSVVAAIAADPTLGGTVSWCIPQSADRPGPVTWNGLEYFGTRIHFNLSAL